MNLLKVYDNHCHTFCNDLKQRSPCFWVSTAPAKHRFIDVSSMLPVGWKWMFQIWFCCFWPDVLFHLLHFSYLQWQQQFWFPARYSLCCHLKLFVHCNWLSNLLTVDWTWSPSSLSNIKWPFLPNPNFLKYCIEAKHREDLSSPCSNQSIPGSA